MQENLPISGLPEDAELKSTDLMVVVDNDEDPGVTKKLPISKLDQRISDTAVAMAVAL